MTGILQKKKPASRAIDRGVITVRQVVVAKAGKGTAGLDINRF